MLHANAASMQDMHFKANAASPMSTCAQAKEQGAPLPETDTLPQDAVR